MLPGCPIGCFSEPTAPLPAYSRTSHRPQGQITRGKTAPNRLRRVDNFICQYDPGLLRLNGAERSFYVDLGYGAEPFTTLESAARLRRFNPDLPVLGVEIDPERVERAVPFADENTFFRLGGFNVPLQPGESIRLIRAMNVLRQYSEAEFLPAVVQMGGSLTPGGLLLEGTSDPFGRIMVINLIRRTLEGSLVMEGLLFSTNFRWGFEPGVFQPVLPKNFIHRMLPGEVIYDFMAAWKQAARVTIGLRPLGLRQWFVASAQALADLGWPIDPRRRLLQQGYLLWKRSVPLPLD
jgi:hypothetical protein